MDAAAALTDAVGGFLAAVARALEGVPVAEPFLARLARLDIPGARAPAGEPARLPVCRHWPAALAAGGDHAEVGAPLEALEPALRWTQTYRRNPPSPGFLEEYGYAVVAGPASGAPALLRSEELALGVLLLGPRTVYPPHAHPAEELYLPLGPAEWLREGEDWRSLSAGAVVHHPPGLAHATRTGDRPLLAVYLWIGDVLTPAHLIVAAGPR